MNVAYKHLDSKLRIAELSIAQWISVFAGVAIGFVWGLYLSPFGLYPTLISAIYLGAIPGAATFFASVSEFDLWLLLGSAIRWRRREGRFVPGPGGSARGYVLRLDPEENRGRATRSQLNDLDLASLWEET
jgi:hypothetical protein